MQKMKCIIISLVFNILISQEYYVTKFPAYFNWRFYASWSNGQEKLS